LTSLGNVRLKNFRDTVEVFQVEVPEESALAHGKSVES
jgi:hypothetical protein